MNGVIFCLTQGRQALKLNIWVDHVCKFKNNQIYQKKRVKTLKLNIWVDHVCKFKNIQIYHEKRVQITISQEKLCHASP